MSQAFRRYEMLLPLRFNDGQPVPNDLIVESLLELRQRFNESCETQTTQGTWKHEGQVYRDDLVRMYVDVPDSAENRMRQLRSDSIDFALVMADLDHFKSLNDSHGHEAGDRALRVFSETLRNEMRADDVACRYGGEEFAVVLPRANAHDAVEVVERVREALSIATSRGETPTFTASFGVAHSSEAADLDDLVQRADRALFTAKDAGRNRICLDGHSTPIAPTLTALA